MLIKEIVLFAYATRGEALEVANDNPGTAVAKVHILRGFTPATTAVAYMVVQEDAYPTAKQVTNPNQPKRK